MQIQEGAIPKQNFVLNLVRTACLTAVALNCVLILTSVVDGTFPVAVIPLAGSLICTWVAFFHELPDPQAEKAAQELEQLSELHSEGIINECDFEKKKDAILNG